MYPETALEQAFHSGELRLGDYIWTTRRGWIKILVITSGQTFIVKDEDGEVFTYYKDGRYYEDDKFPTAFLAPLFQLDSTPKPVRACPPNLKPGDKVMVRSDGGPWRRRYFACRDSDFPGIFCYIEGKTLWTSNGSSTYWKEYRLPTEEENEMF